ncbi:MAG TPA: four helix bundle protein [Anaerolineae bacterium]|nr:four helix bundle protein [Anaerolineae bacterium]
MVQVQFSFEKLEVWQKSIEFTSRVISLVETIEADRRHYRLVEQLEASSASIALNIAEGNGRYSKKEFIRFLYIARGSLYETISLLVIFHKNSWISTSQLDELKTFGSEIGRMISGLIKAVKPINGEQVVI